MLGVSLLALLVIGTVAVSRNFSDASPEAYAITAEVVKENGTVPITLSVQEPENTTYFIYSQNVAAINNKNVEKGINKEFDGKVELTNTNIPNTKKLTISNATGETPLILKFDVTPDGTASTGKIILSDENDKELTNADIPFGTMYNSTTSSKQAVTVGSIDGQSLEKPLGEPINTLGSKTTTKLSTAEEQDVATAAYYAAHGNFNPNANMKEVANQADFVKYYNDNTVTKIKLIADITVNGGKINERKRSIEIDGGYDDNGLHKRHILETVGSARMLRTGGVGVGSNAVPDTYQETQQDGSTVGRSLFHMHDLSLKSNSWGNEAGFVGFPYAYGSLLNNDNQTIGNATRNWYFRFGNLDTDTDDNRKDLSTGMRRLAMVPNAEVTLYGDNNISTTGENFYFGSMVVEDGTSWKGIVEVSDYSIWWVTMTSLATDTGHTQGLDIKNNTFIYLYLLKDGQGYPAIYGNYNYVDIGEGSTMNLNMGGSSWRFDKKGSLTVEKDATLNLISRIKGPGIQFGSGFFSIFIDDSYASGSSVNVKPGGSLFIYAKTGNYSQWRGYGTSAINYDGDGVGTDSRSPLDCHVILDNPKAFDIRNIGRGKDGGDSTNDFNTIFQMHDPSQSFEIRNSDIDLWDTSSNIPMDGPSTENYSKVSSFKVVPNGNDYSDAGISKVTVTVDSALQDTPLAKSFNPRGYKRISAFNNPPQSLWHAVTDADKKMQVKVKLGDTPTGYDANGNTILTPVYAGAGVKVQFKPTDDTSTDWDFTTNTVETDANGVATFTMSDFPETHKEVSAKAIRGTLPDHAWIEESSSSTTVYDVTPPKTKDVFGNGVSPDGTIKKEANVITNATKQLSGEGVEVGADVYLSPDGTFDNAIKIATVGNDGTWCYDLPHYLNAGNTVTIFLKDQATDKEAINAVDVNKLFSPMDFPVTMLTTAPNVGNNRSAMASEKNPTYHDATLPIAKSLTVNDVLPDLSITKKVVAETANGGNVLLNGVMVGDYLTYTISVKNKKAEPNSIWRSVKVEDTLPVGLSLVGGVASNGINLPAADYTYDEATRKLVVQIGNLIEGEENVLTIHTKVTAGAVDQIVSNTATTSGFSPQEKIPDGQTVLPAGAPSEDLNDYLVLSGSDTAALNSPVIGILGLDAPDIIDFGTKQVKATKTEVTNPKYVKLIHEDQAYGETNQTPASFIVEDSRATLTDWTLSAKLSQDLTNDNGKVLSNVLKVKKAGETTLTDLPLGSATVIAAGKNTDRTTDYNINSTWDSNKGEGFVLEVPAGEVKEIGQYSGVLEWTLVAAP